MKVLITAGGTQEDIDSVRSISNKSTGRLGSVIADTFAKANWQVTYICSETAVVPTCHGLDIIRIRNVEGLIKVVEEILHTNVYDCVVHSMAVSDFTPQGIISIDELTEAISCELQKDNIPYEEIPDRIRTVISKCEKPLTDKKINSRSTNTALLLRQTPKVIERIKDIQPKTLLVGFKLLSGVPEEELLQTAFNLLKQNKCDFVLANDLANIKDDMHKAILLDRNMELRRANTKQEIANIIFEGVSERINSI